MTHIKKLANMLNSRAFLYWLLTIGLGIKALTIYVAAQQMFYLEHILQGFLLTVLMPVLLIAVLMGFASFIRDKQFYQSTLIGIACFGSSLLFLGLLYYRVEKHFVFLPDKIPTVSNLSTPDGNLFYQIRIGDLIFVSDFIIILLILLSAVILNQQTGAVTESSETLVEGQKILSAIGLSLEQLKEKSAVQTRRLAQVKIKNEQLKAQQATLSQQKSDLQDKCRNSQPESQKEIACCQTENANLLVSLKKFEALKSQLEVAYQQKVLALQELSAQQASQAGEIANAAPLQQSGAETPTEQEDKVQKAKQIAQQIYEEMRARSQVCQS
ncbi:hypothetical protein FACS1894193_00910 [Bacilli bacterium]|nr:hypothetical protein FACS1894192_00040 [Bacilli bacterium]GHU39812.1 hypothetical protein FACS1894193_00910 [Bacilli bacterium]